MIEKKLQHCEDLRMELKRRNDHYKAYQRPDGCWCCESAMDYEIFERPLKCNVDDTEIQANAICDKFKQFLIGG